MLIQYEQELVDKLVSTIKDNELVPNWLKTYMPFPEMYDIYIDCITYLFSQRPYTLLHGEMLCMSMLHPMVDT